MRVLLTGANGFVGSHLLEALIAARIPTRVLLRASADRSFIEDRLAGVEVRTGSIMDPASLDTAMVGVTHVLHCAGCTKALETAGFFQVNQSGTRNVVEAVNRLGHGVQRLLHVSSLAAGRPGTPDSPAREDDPPRPVSTYGRSKLAGEQEVRDHCRVVFTILRPPAVYGPRDREFLKLFKTVKAHLQPDPGAGRQALSLSFVSDLAAAALACLLHPKAGGRTYYSVSTPAVTAGEMAGEMARLMQVSTLRLPLPTAIFWPLCALAEIQARLTRRPNVLSLQKYAEIRAPGWVCDGSRIQAELGPLPATPLTAGLALTWAAYRKAGWS